MKNKRDQSSRKEESIESSTTKLTNSCTNNDECQWNDKKSNGHSSDKHESLINPITWYNAIISSLPFIGTNQTFIENWIGNISSRIYTFIQFVIPQFPTLHDHPDIIQHLPKALLREMWDNVANVTTQSSQLSLISSSDFMIRHFDTNHDGIISSTELLNITDFVHQLMTLIQGPQQQQSIHEMSWLTWLRREWPLLDWKLGVFIWRSFGGILFILAVLSIIPGRLHGISGKILRWPILGITYLLITVELVYVSEVVSYEKNL